MLRIAICERDKKECSTLLEYIARDTEIEDDYITECFGTVADVKKRIDASDFNFDLLFLMIGEIGTDSLALTEYVRERKFDVDIFFLAETVDFVTEAFRYNVFLYLVKPFDFYKFAYEMKQYLKEKKNCGKDYLSVSVHGKEQMIPLSAVWYFTSDVRKIGAVFFNDEKEIWFYGKLEELEQKLKDYGYLRCHQSYLINGHWIEGINGNEVITSGGSFQISRKYLKNVREEWEKISKRLYHTAHITSVTGKHTGKERTGDDTMNDSSTAVVTKKYGMGAVRYGLLIGLRGVGKNVSFRLYHGEEVTVGRDEKQAQIVIKNRAISRRHCGVRFDAEKQCYFVYDYSKNGTYISGFGAIPKEKWLQVKRDVLLQIVNEETSFLLL